MNKFAVFVSISLVMMASLSSASDFSGSASTLLSSGNFSTGSTNSPNFECNFKSSTAQLGEPVSVSCEIDSSLSAVPYPDAKFELRFDSLFGGSVDSLYGLVFATLLARCEGMTTDDLICRFETKQVFEPNNGCSGVGCLPRTPVPAPGCVGYLCLP